jgi:hypothetical protein
MRTANMKLKTLNVGHTDLKPSLTDCGRCINVQKHSLEGVCLAGLGPVLGLSVHPAFSRLPDQPKTHVQDLIRRHAGTVWSEIFKGGGRV